MRWSKQRSRWGSPEVKEGKEAKKEGQVVGVGRDCPGDLDSGRTGGDSLGVRRSRRESSPWSVSARGKATAIQIQPMSSVGGDPGTPSIGSTPPIPASAKGDRAQTGVASPSDGRARRQAGTRDPCRSISTSSSRPARSVTVRSHFTPRPEPRTPDTEPTGWAVNATRWPGAARGRERPRGFDEATGEDASVFRRRRTVQGRPACGEPAGAPGGVVRSGYRGRLDLGDVEGDVAAFDIQQGHRETRPQLLVQEVNGVPESGPVSPAGEGWGPYDAVESAQVPFVRPGKGFDAVVGGGGGRVVPAAAALPEPRVPGCDPRLAPPVHAASRTVIEHAHDIVRRPARHALDSAIPRPDPGRPGPNHANPFWLTTAQPAVDRDPAATQRDRLTPVQPVERTWATLPLNAQPPPIAPVVPPHQHERAPTRPRPAPARTTSSRGRHP